MTQRRGARHRRRKRRVSRRAFLIGLAAAACGAVALGWRRHSQPAAAGNEPDPGPAASGGPCG